jgi:hypothetical protein
MILKRSRAFRLIAVLLIIVALCAQVPAAQASGSVPFAPLWQHVNTTNTALLFSGGNATCNVTVNALSGSSIDADVYLYRKNSNNSYSLVKSWTNQTASGSLFFSETQSITSGVTYKLTFSAEVTRNGVSETVSGNVERTAP